MTKKKPKNGFSQEAVGEIKPFEGQPEIEASVILKFDIVKVDGKKILKFIMEDIDGSSYDIAEEIMDNGNKTGEFRLAIKKNTKLNITLDKYTKWRWRKDGTQITTKDHSQIKYYGVDGEFSDDDNTISLYIKARSGNEFTDHLCFSIEIGQDGKYWLPITIDPEIKNPPGGGGQYLIEKSTGSKPFRIMLSAMEVV